MSKYVKPTPLALPTPGGVSVGSLAQAKRHKRKFDAVITIEEPGARPNLRLRFAPDPGREHLVLQFEDVEALLRKCPKDSVHESSRLMGADEQTAPRPLPHDELEVLQRSAGAEGFASGLV